MDQPNVSLQMLRRWMKGKLTKSKAKHRGSPKWWPQWTRHTLSEVVPIFMGFRNGVWVGLVVICLSSSDHKVVIFNNSLQYFIARMEHKDSFTHMNVQWIHIYHHMLYINLGYKYCHIHNGHSLHKMITIAWFVRSLRGYKIRAWKFWCYWKTHTVCNINL